MIGIFNTDELIKYRRDEPFLIINPLIPKRYFWTFSKLIVFREATARLFQQILLTILL